MHSATQIIAQWVTPATCSKPCGQLYNSIPSSTSNWSPPSSLHLIPKDLQCDNLKNKFAASFVGRSITVMCQDAYLFHSLRSSCQNFVWSPGYSSCLGYLSYSTNKSPSDWMLHRQMDFQHQVQCSLYHCPLQACVWRSHPLPWMLWQSHQADNTPKHFNQTLQPWLVCFRKHVLLYKLINVMQIPCRHFTYFKGRHSICSPSTPPAPLKLLVKQLSLPDASPATSIFSKMDVVLIMLGLNLSSRL